MVRIYKAMFGDFTAGCVVRANCVSRPIVQLLFIHCYAAGPQTNHESRIRRRFRIRRVDGCHVPANTRDSVVRCDAVVMWPRHDRWRVSGSGLTSTWRRQPHNCWYRLAVQGHFSVRQVQWGTLNTMTVHRTYMSKHDFELILEAFLFAY